MQLVPCTDYDDLSARAETRLREIARARPDALLCAATGSSPVGLYERMAANAAAYARLRVLKLDEWIGVPPDDPATPHHSAICLHSAPPSMQPWHSFCFASR